MPNTITLRAIIADDQPNIRNTLKMYIEMKTRASVDTSETRTDLVRMVQEAHDIGNGYRIIITDNRMPNQPG